MKEIEVEGANVKDAIEEGLKKLGAKREDIEIKILDEGTTGLFGLVGSKAAKVRVKLKNPGNTAPPAEENVENKSNNTDLADTPAENKDIVKAITEVSLELMKRMKLDNMSASVRYEDGSYKTDIDGDDKRLLIGKNGQTLNAFQLILSLIISRDHATKVRLDVDIDEYQKRRNEQLVQLAHKIAEKVKSSGEPEKLEPMSSRDRMVIHMALKDVSGVETMSEGRGSSRRIYVKVK